MIIISALIGLIAGIVLTILTEIVKKAGNKKLAASKIYSKSVLLLQELIVYDNFSLEHHAREIYGDKGMRALSESEKKLNTLIDLIKKSLKENIAETELKYRKLKSNPLEIEKMLYEIQLFEDQYKNDKFILSAQEISYLNYSIQPLVTEWFFDNYQMMVEYKFLLKDYKMKI